jgi:hypothetical protein
MFRTVVGSLLALIGAAAAVWSPFRAWYAGRHGSVIRVDDLFTEVGVTPAKAALLGSLFLPMAFAALLTLLGVLLRSRLALCLSALLVLGITILWMVRQGQSAGSLTAGGNGLDYGVATAFTAGLLILLGAFLLPRGSRRRPRHHGYPDPALYGAPAYGQPGPEETAAYGQPGPEGPPTATYEGAPYTQPGPEGPPTATYEAPTYAQPEREPEETAAYGQPGPEGPPTATYEAPTYAQPEPEDPPTLPSSSAPEPTAPPPAPHQGPPGA